MSTPRAPRNAAAPGTGVVKDISAEEEAAALKGVAPVAGAASAPAAPTQPDGTPELPGAENPAAPAPASAPAQPAPAAPVVASTSPNGKYPLAGGYEVDVTVFPSYFEFDAMTPGCSELLTELHGAGVIVRKMTAASGSRIYRAFQKL